MWEDAARQRRPAVRRATPVNISLSYQLTQDEIRRALTSMARAKRVLLWVICVLLLLMGGLVLVAGNLGAGLPLLFLGLFYIFLLAVAPRLAIRKQAERLCIPTRLQLTDAGFEIETALERAEIRWVAVNRVRATDAAFLLYRTKRVANVVPKRAFDAAQLAEFSAFSLSYAGRTAPPAPAPVAD